MVSGRKELDPTVDSIVHVNTYLHVALTSNPIGEVKDRFTSPMKLHLKKIHFPCFYLFYFA